MINQKAKEKILELELRNNIFFLVSRQAGSHLRELERKSNIPYSTLKYHLHFLAKNELIREKKTDNQIRYYPQSLNSQDFELLALLRQKNIRRILLFLIVNIKATPKEIEEFTKLSPSTINWYLQRLLKKEVITKSNGFYKLAIEKELLIRLIVTYRTSFLDEMVDRVSDMWEIS